MHRSNKKNAARRRRVTVSVLAGHKVRTKVVGVAGLSPEETHARISRLCAVVD